MCDAASPGSPAECGAKPSERSAQPAEHSSQPGTESHRNPGSQADFKSGADSRTARRRVTGRAALARRAVLAYQDFLSPLKMGPSCRFEPTCSNYALTALESHGLLKGLLLSIGRLLRCAPWHPGGWDPVPPRKRRAMPKPEETPQDFETSEK